MAQKKVYDKPTQENTGFGKNSLNTGGRFFTKDGKPNVVRRGMSWFNRTSWYHSMLEMSRWKFLFILLLFYALINLVFAAIYFMIGVEYLNGIHSETVLERFAGAYFFSAQTFTTVGYGHISPTGFLASSVAASEALVGLLSFAIATGLFYARFSMPKAHLRFSENALIAPYGDGMALMFRMVPFKNNNLTDAEVKMTLGMSILQNGVPVNRFYQLTTEFSRVNSLSLSWTVVHPITEESPLYGMNETDFLSASGELLVFVTAFDEMYSSTVAAKTSYVFEEIVYGARFDMMYGRDESNRHTLIQLDKLNAFTRIPMN